jgi:hypothetical protein
MEPVKEPRITIYLQTSPMQYERALTFKTGVELDNNLGNNEASVYVTHDKALLALALLADALGAEVFYEGERISVEL